MVLGQISPERENQMKKTLMCFALLGLPVGVVAGTADCGAPVQVVTNSILTAQEIAAVANTVLSDAQVAWPIVLSFIPATSQAQANAVFQTAMFVANKAVLTLEDAIQTAQALNQSNPDFTAAIQAVSDAVAQVIAVVNQFTQGGGGDAGTGAAPMPQNVSAAVSQLNADLATFKKIAKTK